MVNLRARSFLLLKKGSSVTLHLLYSFQTQISPLRERHSSSNNPFRRGPWSKTLLDKYRQITRFRSGYGNLLSDDIHRILLLRPPFLPDFFRSCLFCRITLVLDLLNKVWKYIPHAVRDHRVYLPPIRSISRIESGQHARSRIDSSSKP